MDIPGPSMIVVLVLLVAFSAFFSSSETALASVNKIRMKTRAEDGDKRAARVIRLSEDFDRTLSAILVGNNVVNIAAASISTVFFTQLMGAARGPAMSTAVTTVLVLIFGEILPKSIAKENAEAVALATSVPLEIIKTVLSPVVWILVQIKRLLTGRRSNELNVQPSVTEEELKTIIDTVEEEGVLNRQETDIIQSAIEFDNITVQEILVPRVDMAAVEADAPGEEIVELCLKDGFSRIPVYEDSIDNIIGVVHVKDLLAAVAQGRPIEARALLREVKFVYRTKRINDLLAELRREKQHMAIVTDDHGGTMGLVTMEDILEELVGEIWDTKRINDLLAELRREKQHMAIVTDDHGGTMGLVTMEDILEELVGEIWDESDQAKTSICQTGEHTWQVSGDTAPEDLFEAIGFRDKNFDSEYSTVGGWALEILEHIPAEGETFHYKELDARILKVNDQRIQQVEITYNPPEPEESDRLQDL